MISKTFLFYFWTELRFLGNHSGDGENKSARKTWPRTAAISPGIALLRPAAGIKPPASLQIAVNIELPALLKQIIHPGLLFITYYNIQEFHLGAMKSLPVKN